MVRAQVCHLHAGQILNHKERGLAGRHWCGENVSGAAVCGGEIRAAWGVNHRGVFHGIVDSQLCLLSWQVVCSVCSRSGKLW
jgi:hypothetical protein